MKTNHGTTLKNRTLGSIRALLFLCASFLIASSSFFTPAQASADRNANIQVYKLEGTQQELRKTLTTDDLNICTDFDDYTCQRLQTEQKKTKIECTGQTGNGGWIEKQISDVDRRCWVNLNLCYKARDVVVGQDAQGNAISVHFDDICVSLDGRDEQHAIPDFSVKFDPSENHAAGGDFSLCGSDDSGTHKEYCVWPVTDEDSAQNYAPVSARTSVDPDSGATSGLTGNTGDDMFRIDYGSKGFLEYLDNPSAGNRLKYLERTGGDTRPMMIPAGPKGTLNDYNNFINNPPSDVEVKNACYPVKAEVVCDISTLPDMPIPGVCGAAAYVGPGVYSHYNDIPNEHLCYVGDETAVSNYEGSYVTWKCLGKNGGDTSSTCRYTYSQDGQCGSSHLAYFDTKSALDSNNAYCAGGSAMAGAVSGEGPWFWTCGATGSQGNDAYCTAYDDDLDCDSFFENNTMVFVQDLSGSFADDISNTKNALNALFADPVFNEWSVGLTSTAGSDGSSSVYQKQLDWTDVSTGKSTILNKINGYGTTGSEDPIYAIYRAIQDFFPRADGRSGTIVMITDESDGNREDYLSKIKDKMDEHNLKLVVLVTSGVKSYYQNVLSNAGIEYDLETITSDSSNLAASLLSGLTKVNCENK